MRLASNRLLSATITLGVSCQGAGGNLLAPQCYAFLYQFMERFTAFTQFSIFISYSCHVFWGLNTISLCLSFCSSSLSAQNPTARPARVAAPKQDMSKWAGLSIGALNKSEVICMTNALLQTPPSALWGARTSGWVTVRTLTVFMWLLEFLKLTFGEERMLESEPGLYSY